MPARARKNSPGAKNSPELKKGARRAAPGPDADTQRLVRLDGLAVRRRRHDHGWSPRDLVDAIGEASFVASGLRRTLTPNQIQAIEEREEQIVYADLLLLCDGLACDPSDLIAEGEMSSKRPRARLH